ncbi:hypothetical protein OUZ56_011940 [Daphnia magna]|uniref:Uncharacterized protein n=1 Tax=Daphnia magna TaxID=35525 RepID=A0ABQ9Z1K7_9CRUS|nr:hypothetical protein OUZ56_011940 [Daphnia magna]
MQVGPTGLSFTATPTGEGKGYLEIPRIPESDNTSRLYDTSRQIEISFLNKPDKDIVPIGHIVVGIPLTYSTFPAETTKILCAMFKTTLTTCHQNTEMDTSVCNDYSELYKSRTRRWTLQDIQFLIKNPLEDEQLGTQL